MRRMPAVACFTFDNMGEAAEVGAGRLAGPLAPGARCVVGVRLSGDLCAARAHRRARHLLRRGLEWGASPRCGAEIVERGHELGMHGWLHEDWSALPSDAERELARAPAGLRAPPVRAAWLPRPGGARTAHTERILLDLGYTYDASLGDGMRPLRLPCGLAQVPFVWPGVDGFHYLTRTPPADPAAVRDAWLGALRRAIDRGGLFVTVCHAFLTGVDPARVAALEAVIAATRDAGVEICTVGQVADRVR
jgi:peptidoglycan/xylan/chitin deacetylase (PgdA/CDA1 family)